MTVGKLRICHLITDLGPAGAERSLYDLVTRLDGDRFDVQVVALRGGPVQQWLSRAGIPVTVLHLRGKWDVLRLRRLTQVLRDAQPDIVHTHLFHADLAGRPAARLAAVPHLIHTVRTAEGRFRPWQFSYARFLGGYCDRLVCISESVRRHHKLHSGVPAHKYTVIHNGVDVARFRRDSAARKRLRKEWGIPAGHVVVGYVGRLAPEKGIDILLSAISHLGARGEPVNVVIAGQGPRQHMVENFIRYGEGGKQCRMLGFVQDVPSLLSAVDVVVVPSRWEGFGLSAAEAMAAGLPVIASDVGHLQDMIVHGETGLLVERGDVVAISEAIGSLAEDADGRKRLGAAAKKHVTSTYPIEATVSAHEALYTDVAGQ